MEDAKIDSIAREVLFSLKKARADSGSVATPSPDPPSQPSQRQAEMHPSLRLLSVVGGVLGSPCIVEPDKPCVGSLKCRTFGH